HLPASASRRGLSRHRCRAGAGEEGCQSHGWPCVGGKHARAGRDLFHGAPEVTTESLPQPILLVEDNPVDLDLTQRAFARRRFGNPVEIARDGEEALAWIGRWAAGEPLPAVILLDIKLPSVHGLDELRRLKTHGRYRTIPDRLMTYASENP